MGLFDFLFWSKEIKTDTQKYMEERNRDYARKVRMYKEREDAWTKNSTVDVYKPKSQQQNNMPTQSLTSYLKTTAKPTTSNYAHKTQEQLKQELLQKYGHPQAHKPAAKQDCKTQLDYTTDKKSDFSVLAVVFDPQKGIAKVTGRVERGRFERGDVVKIGESNVELPIIGMIRQGEPVDYVNSASGTVVINFKTRHDLPLSKGQSLHKNTL